MKKYIIAFLLLVLAVPFKVAADRFFVESADLELGKTASLRFVLENSQDFYGFQAEVNLPKGLQALRGTDGELDITLSDRAATGDFRVNSNLLQDGSLIMGAFSANHKPFSSNDGVLVNMNVSVDETFAGGIVTISNVMFIDSRDKDVPFESSSASFGIIVTGISLNKTSLSITEGEKSTLTATINPTDATDKSVTWSSSDTSVATVTANGEVTAVKAGTATITATSANGKTATCKVTVTAKVIEVTGISINKAALNLAEGETATLTATINPSNATDKSVIWSSSDTSVATVTAAGEVTAVKAGTSTITATSANGKTATCKVTVTAKVIEVTGISISRTELNLAEGETATLTATINPTDATDKSVTWSSSDTSVAIVSAAGEVSAVKAGTATITATSANGKTATCKVTVTAKVIEVTGISISRTELKLAAGETDALTATINPSNATDKSVTWSSSDTSVATVTANGEVSAVKAGTATITATSANGKTATCKVTVMAKVIEVTGISISKTELNLAEGETATLTATINPSNATDKSVTWSSSDTSVATVTANGEVSAVKAGTSTIIATSANGKTATCKVAVVANVVYVQSLAIDPKECNGVEGGEFTITVTIFPENSTDKGVVFESNDTDVATVDSHGKVVILKEGTCIITVSTVDGSGLTAQCIVTSVAGIDAIFSDPNAEIDVLDLNGIMVKRNCTRNDLKVLPPSVYILRNGNYVVKAVVR